MTTLSVVGRARLKAYIEEFCTDRARETFAICGEAAWLNSIAADGCLEIAGRYTKNGVPVTVRFSGYELKLEPDTRIFPPSKPPTRRPAKAHECMPGDGFSFDHLPK